MSATYDPGLSTDKDWVRFLAGDRDVSAPSLQDEEIGGLLEQYANKYLAAAAACETIIAMSGGLVRKEVGDLKLQWSHTSEDTYRKHIQWLRKKGAMEMATSPKVFRVLS